MACSVFVTANCRVTRQSRGSLLHLAIYIASLLFCIVSSLPKDPFCVKLVKAIDITGVDGRPSILILSFPITQHSSRISPISSFSHSFFSFLFLSFNFLMLALSFPFCQTSIFIDCLCVPVLQSSIFLFRINLPPL
jgi:hypothetical protein